MQRASDESRLRFRYFGIKTYTSTLCCHLVDQGRFTVKTKYASSGGTCGVWYHSSYHEIVIKYKASWGILFNESKK